MDGLRKMMMQSAPFPDELADIVAGWSYRPGWTFRLAHIVREHVDPEDDHSAPLSEGLTLDITTSGFNSYHVDEGPNYRVHHYMIVPAATYNRESWRRWVLEQCLLVERHEAMEFAEVHGVKPWAPTHGPGDDPYIVRELATDEQRATSFRGTLNP